MDYIRIIFISFEFLFLFSLLPILLFLDADPTPLQSNYGDVIKYICLMPITLLAYEVKEANSILFPIEDKTGKLQKWPGYNLHRFRTAIGIVYQVIFIALSLIAWIFWSTMPMTITVSLLAVAALGSLAVAASFLLASIRVKELFREL